MKKRFLNLWTVLLFQKTKNSLNFRVLYMLKNILTMAFYYSAFFKTRYNIFTI